MEPGEQVSHAFCLRFLERFCEYFGLVIIRKVKKQFGYLNYSVQTTPFFEKLFYWKLDSTQNI